VSLADLRVLSLESRKAKDMEALILREHGIPIIAPSVQERPLDDNTAAFQFVERLEAGEFDLVICMTGVGLAFLRDIIVTRMPIERLAAALNRVTIVARGPKPIAILRPMGVPVTVVIQEPNTWREIVEAVASRKERKIAIQQYGRPNPELDSALEALGASVTQFALYRWELPSDLAPLQSAARKLAAGEVDIVLFTSSIQLDHLLRVAQDLGVESQVRHALLHGVVNASIGPVMSDALRAAGFPVDIVPHHPKMWALVKAAAQEAEAAIGQKRRAAAAAMRNPATGSA
jgi:uroporphyrinogen-III synthase